LRSPSCGFATDSTIPEKRAGLRSPRLHGFSAAQIWIAMAGGQAAREMSRCCNRKVAIGRLGVVLVMVLRRHLPCGPKAFLVLLALSDESR
jgi:hypothetical protein